jgi:outer membrane protein
MKINLLILLFSLTGMLVQTQAQEKLTLSVQDACNYALQHNLTLKNSTYAIDKSQQSVREAIAAGLPQIAATLDYSNALGAEMSIRFSEALPAQTIPINPTSNFYVNVSQLIFSANYWVGVETSKMAKQLSVINHYKSEQDVIAQVTETYYLYLVSSGIREILNRNVLNLNELYTKTAAMAAAGIIEQTSVDQLSIQVNALKNSVKSAERQLELAANMLRFQLGMSLSAEFELTDPINQLMEKAINPEIALGQLNLQSNPDYMLIHQQTKITENMVDMQKANFLPTVAGFYRFTQKVLKPEFDMTPPNMLGVQVNIPIFSSGQRYSQLNQAKIDLKSMKNTQLLVEDQLLLQEKQLKFNYKSALETYYNQQENIEVSRKVYDNLRYKFEQGMISGLDLINADNNYLKAETDYLSAMLEVMKSDLQLRKIYGTLIKK